MNPDTNSKYFTIRPCQRDDMPSVARFFVETYRAHQGSRLYAIQNYLQNLFLDHQDYDAETGSRVYEDKQGRVTGFFGILPARFALNGRELRAAVGHLILVERGNTDPFIPAKLVRSLFAGPQELTFSECSSPVAVALWKPQGAQVVPGYGTEWMRILRPSGFACHFLGRPLARALRPATSAVDKLIASAAGQFLKVNISPKSFAGDEDASVTEMIDLALEVREQYKLRPIADSELLDWQLQHAAEKSAYGECHRRIVYARGRKPLGGYVYYGRQGGCAFAMQIFARPGAAGAVVDSLLAHAYKSGNAIIRGKIEPRIAEALLERRCVFHLRTSTQVCSKDPEVLTAIRSGDASLMGLSGETWTRIVGHRWKNSGETHSLMTTFTPHRQPGFCAE